MTERVEAAANLLLTLESRARREEVQLSAGRVCWRAWGSGPPLVLLHGGHGSWRHWVRNIDALAAKHTLWVPDMPGYGDSDTPVCEPRDPGRLALLVRMLTDSLDILLGSRTEVDVAGFSFGGLVASHLAATRGQVRRLALLGPGGHAGPRRQSIDMIEWRGLNDAARRDALRHNLAAFMLHEACNIDALALQVHEASVQRTRFRSKALSRQPPLLEALKTLDLPVLAIWGEHDVTAVPELAAQAVLQQRPEREARIVPSAGHWVQYERPEMVTAWLQDWFSTTSANTAPGAPAVQPAEAHIPTATNP